MPDTVTPNLGLTKPEIGGSSNTWGNKLNADMDILDSVTPKMTNQWKMYFGDGNPAAGPFYITRYDNAAVAVDNPLTINRQTGDVTILHNIAVTKQVFASAGTAGAPSFSFLLEATLGFFRSAAGKMGFSGRLNGDGAIPSGAVMDFAMAAAPTGWLACDGQAVSRATYADLFTAIGTTFGAGDGSTTFNVPNAGSRFRRHRDGGGLSLAGAVGNSQSPVNLAHTHSLSGSPTITIAAVPNHTHTINVSDSRVWELNWARSGQAATVGLGPSSVDYNTNGVTNIEPAGSITATADPAGGHTPTATWGTNTLAAASDGNANEARPYSLTVLTCIKT